MFQCTYLSLSLVRSTQRYHTRYLNLSRLVLVCYVTPVSFCFIKLNVFIWNSFYLIWFYFNMLATINIEKEEKINKQENEAMEAYKL